MAVHHAEPGEIVDVRPLGEALKTTQTATLVKTDELEIIRLVVTADKESPTHSAPGQLVVECLEGKIAFSCLGKTQELVRGDLLYLPAGEPHSVKGIEDGSLLLTILLPKESQEQVADLSTSVFWLVLPSRPFFVLLPMLLKKTDNFYLSFGTATMAMIGMRWLLCHVR